MALSSDMKTVSKMTYLNRKLKNMTLRELANKTGLSHGYLNRFEQGLVRPSNATMKQLLDVLDVKIEIDDALDNAFLNLYERLDQALFYDQRQESRELYKELRAHHDYYIHSKYFGEYYLIMLSAIQATRLDMTDIEAFYRPADIIADKLDKPYREQMVFERALHMVINGNLYKAWRYAKQHVESLNNDHLRARVYYLLGYTIANDYNYYHDALKYFEKARILFEENMNYRRSNRCKAMEQILFVYLHRFEEYEKSVAETDQYSIANKEFAIYYFTSVNKARYYIIKEAYQQALDILETFTSDVFEYHFYKAFSYFKLNRSMEALNEIQTLRKRPEVLVTGFEKDITNLLEYAIVHDQDKAYLDKLKHLEQQAHAQRDFVMIQIITNLYTEALQEKRRYKEAQRVLERFLAVLYKIN